MFYNNKVQTNSFILLPFFLLDWAPAASSSSSMSSSLANTNYSPLTAQDVRSVEKVLFFTGYPRSGHSIVGSLIDAHPNIVLSRAFYLFTRLSDKPSEEVKNRTAFFQEMYKKSYEYSRVSASKDGKGYTLDVPGAWSGTFNHLKVIGDKSAKATTNAYLSYPGLFKRLYSKLQGVARVPVYVIHVVRNPFDMIATHALLTQRIGLKPPQIREKMFSEENQMNNSNHLEKVAKQYFEWARAVYEMVPLCNMTILEIHNKDLVKHTTDTILKICSFLEVDCPGDYIDACVNKVYNNVSMTRNFVHWPMELKVWIEEHMQLYPFFERYSFD